MVLGVIAAGATDHLLEPLSDLRRAALASSVQHAQNRLQMNGERRGERPWRVMRQQRGGLIERLDARFDRVFLAQISRAHEPDLPLTTAKGRSIPARRSRARSRYGFVREHARK